MAANSGTQSRRQRFDELMQAGTQALEAGDRRAAHDRWREAATLDPYDEQVWVSLLRVLDNEEDRHVCLENIIAINPLNAQARRLLRQQAGDISSTSIPIPPQATETTTQPKRPDAAARQKQKTSTQKRAATSGKKQTQTQKQKQKARQTQTLAKSKAKPQSSIGRIIGLVIGALVIAILLGLVISLVVYGRH